jgi:nucleoside-diphosphate-sugar epimerase
MSRILVTGAAGFIGRHTLPALQARGFEVHGTSRHTLGDREKFSGSMLHNVDVLDASAAAALVDRVRPTHLLLAAWTTTPGEFWTDPRNEAWAAATEAIARSFYAAGGRRVVVAGSCAEYDWLDPALTRGPLREDAAQGVPHTIYGRAKRRAAAALAKAAEEAGAEYAIGRIFFPMGPGESRRRFLPDLAEALLAGLPAKLGPGDQLRDVIDVRDVGAALAAIVDSTATGPLNIGTGKGIRLADVARRAGEMLGRTELIMLGSLPPRPNEPPALVADIGRLSAATGFRPRHDLDDMLSAALSYWRAVAHV